MGISTRSSDARTGSVAALVAALLLLVMPSIGCKRKESEGPQPPTKALMAQVLRARARLIELARRGDRDGLAKMIDAEMGMRLEAAVLHARARPIDQFPLAQRAAAKLKDPAQVRLKAAELFTKLSRGLVKNCRFVGPPELRTPHWPTKKREGWELILETAKLCGPVFDVYARCRTGLNLEIRLAQRAGGGAWRVVAVRELPFGTTKPPKATIPRWE